MSANVRSRWVDGNLVFSTDAGVDLMKIDAAGEKVVILATGALEVLAGATVSGIVAADAATDATAGAVELATDAEAQTGTATDRVITPANLQAVTGTETRKGVLELATDAEAQAGVDTARAITPANLQAVTGTETRKGVLELATDAEAQAGVDTARAITPANLQAVTATAARKGVAALASTAEAKAGADAAKIITSALLAAVLVNCKVLSFTGKNNVGACTLTGAALGDRVIGICGLEAASIGGADASFESTITVADQIQQSAVGDLSTKHYLVILLPVA